jgi:hypothetical protein
MWHHIGWFVLLRFDGSPSRGRALDMPKQRSAPRGHVTHNGWAVLPAHAPKPLSTALGTQAFLLRFQSDRMEKEDEAGWQPWVPAIAIRGPLR